MQTGGPVNQGRGQRGLTPLRPVWYGVGIGCVLLAGLGLALPLLPTTPFLLLAAFAFARSSERWHAWLLRHRLFGPIIDDWRRHGAIDRRTKIVSVASMAGVFGMSLALDVVAVVLVVQAVALTASAAFVLSRPAPPGR
jgi:uncharacterized membrane protein YbaN (DUF454 family)